jgi:hypothetical protein
MKTFALSCALAVICLAATSGCASRRPMYRSYNGCPQAPCYCQPTCPTPCMNPCYGGGQMAYPANYGGVMPYAPNYGGYGYTGYGYSGGYSGYMPYAPSEGMAYPASYGGSTCPTCNN